jgi:pathogenesis-related protein 1
MRLTVALVILFGCTDARAQYPWGYGQYGPANPPHAYPFTAPAEASQSISQAMLEAHNAVRAQIGLPPLAWSSQLAKVAQYWADHLISTRELRHQPNNRYGENLYAISGGTSSPAQVVKLWADEARSYDVRTNSCADVCGHYTQIVWRATRDVGCAEATDRYRQVWVCEYDPPGNVVGYWPY